jgi:hypothetical protein
MAYFYYSVSLYFLLSVLLMYYLLETCLRSVFGCLSFIKHFKLAYEKLNFIIFYFGGTKLSSFFFADYLDFLDLFRRIILKACLEFFIY